MTIGSAQVFIARVETNCIAHEPIGAPRSHANDRRACCFFSNADFRGLVMIGHGCIPEKGAILHNSAA